MEAFSAEAVHPPGIIMITSDKSEEGRRKNTHESTVSGLQVNGEDNQETETLVETPSIVIPPESPRNRTLGKTQFSFSGVSLSSTFEGSKTASPTDKLSKAVDEQHIQVGDMEKQANVTAKLKNITSNLPTPKSELPGPTWPELLTGFMKKEPVNTEKSNETTDDQQGVSSILQDSASRDVPFDEMISSKNETTVAEEEEEYFSAVEECDSHNDTPIQDENTQYDEEVPENESSDVCKVNPAVQKPQEEAILELFLESGIDSNIEKSDEVTADEIKKVLIEDKCDIANIQKSQDEEHNIEDDKEEIVKVDMSDNEKEIDHSSGKKKEVQDNDQNPGPMHADVESILGYPHNHKEKDELVIKILAEVHAAAYQPTNAGEVVASHKETSQEESRRKPERKEPQEESPEPTEEELEKQRLKIEAKENKKKEEVDLVAKILAEVHATVEPFHFFDVVTDKEDNATMKVEKEIVNEKAMHCTDTFEMESAESEDEGGHTMEGSVDGIDYTVTRILAEGLIHKRGTGNDWLGNKDWKLRHARLVMAKVKGYDIEVPVLLINWLRLSPTPSTLIILDSAAIIPIDKEDTSQWDAYCFDIAQIKSPTEIITRTFTVSKTARDEWMYAINQAMHDYDTRKLEAKKVEKTMARSMPSLADESDGNQQKSNNASIGATASFINALSKQSEIMHYLTQILLSEDQEDPASLREEEEKQKECDTILVESDEENTDVVCTEESKKKEDASNIEEVGTTESTSKAIEEADEIKCKVQFEIKETEEQALRERQPASSENKVESKTAAIEDSYMVNALMKLLFALTQSKSADDATKQNISIPPLKENTKTSIATEENSTEKSGAETSTELALVGDDSSTLFDALVSGLGCTNISSQSDETDGLSDIVVEGREEESLETNNKVKHKQEIDPFQDAREAPNDEEVEQDAAEQAHTGCDAQVEEGEACTNNDTSSTRSAEIDTQRNIKQCLATIDENPGDDASAYCGAGTAF